jgi:hypothetical protein
MKQSGRVGHEYMWFRLGERSGLFEHYNEHFKITVSLLRS